jgi:predicted nucleotidyltransferase
VIALCQQTYEIEHKKNLIELILAIQVVDVTHHGESSVFQCCAFNYLSAYQLQIMPIKILESLLKQINFRDLIPECKCNISNQLCQDKECKFFQLFSKYSRKKITINDVPLAMEKARFHLGNDYHTRLISIFSGNQYLFEWSELKPFFELLLNLEMTQFYSILGADIYDKSQERFRAELKSTIDRLLISQSYEKKLTIWGDNNLINEGYRQVFSQTPVLSGTKLTRLNTQLVSPVVARFLLRVESEFGTDVAVFFSGSYARNEMTPSSDLDMGFVSIKPELIVKAKILAIHYFSIEAGLEVEFFPDVDPRQIKNNLQRCPQLFINFYYMEQMGGNTLYKISSVFASIFNDPMYLIEALTSHYLLRETPQSTSPTSIVKYLLKEIKIVMLYWQVLMRGNQFNCIITYLSKAKLVLLNIKNQLAYVEDKQFNLDNLMTELSGYLVRAYNLIEQKLLDDEAGQRFFSRKKVKTIEMISLETDPIKLRDYFLNLDVAYCSDFLILLTLMRNPKTPVSIASIIEQLAEDDPWLTAIKQPIAHELRSPFRWIRKRSF